MIYHKYRCHHCKIDINPAYAYPQEDDEFQFCSVECHDKYIEENGEEPRTVIMNY